MAIALTQMFQLKQNNLRYILQWSAPNKIPYLYLGSGIQMFLESNCSFSNCYITSDKEYFYGTDDFDAIIFDVRDLQRLRKNDFPPKRCWRQKYILTATESADSLPICNKYSLYNYFNWTWTYKLNSDLTRPYLTVYDSQGELIGPSINMPWIDKQLPITSSLIPFLNNKNRAVAWFVDECETRSKREKVANELSQQLGKYGLSVDIYGHCGSNPCSEDEPRCLAMLSRHYFFYLAFENSMAPDFVTGSVVTAFDNFVVPVVYGAADYHRFLPPGSYLDAQLLGPKRLAKRMVEIISNQKMFHEFFRWRNHYEIVRNELTADICDLCSIMNDQDLLLEETNYNDIGKWFNVNSKFCKNGRWGFRSRESIFKEEKSPEYNLSMTEDDSSDSSEYSSFASDSSSGGV